MGQKVNPHGMRLGIVKTWDAKWYAGKDFAANLHEDIKIRSFLKETLKVAGVSKIETERSKNRLRLTIHTAKPGMVIGRGGSGIEQLKKGLKKYTDKHVDINIAEIKQPDMDATLVAENIASQLERRVAFRRAMKQAVSRTIRMGAKGIKVTVGAVSAVLKLLVVNLTVKVVFHFILYVLILIMVQLKHIQLMAVLA